MTDTRKGNGRADAGPMADARKGNGGKPARPALTKAEAERILSLPNGSEALFEDPEAAFDASWALFLEGNAAAAAFLARCAKREALRERINLLLGPGRDVLYAALTSPSPKLRKNAARLTGALGVARDAHALSQALGNEPQRFVRPSLILALGALGNPEAQRALEGYVVEPAPDKAGEAHVREEQEALVSALRRFATLQKHAFTGLKEPRELELRTPDRLSDSLAYELASLHIRPDAVFRDALRVRSADIGALYGCRSFYELLFPIARNASPLPGAIAARAKEQFAALLAGAHSGTGPFGYRIELRGDDVERGRLAREIAAHLDGALLVNSPSDYEAELRVELRSGVADIYLKLFTIPDARFDYRRHALPASMHPATAAAIVRHARSYLKPNARVLDPCCGSGTFLIEREKFLQASMLLGVDIADKAVDMAWENARAAGSAAKFIAKDCLRFEAREPFDEVVANLPFGNRVGSHEDNEQLYAGLIRRLPAWLAPGGVAILYTMEFALLRRLILKSPALSLATEGRTAAGGLMPGIFILRRNPN